MRGRTELHLATARQNSDFAAILVRTYDDAPPSLNWAAVVAFYAAVHYVNAYLWEVARVEPRNHFERAKLINTLSILDSLIPGYRRLQGYSINARYNPGFQMESADVRRLLDTDLATVAQVVDAALLPPEE